VPAPGEVWLGLADLEHRTVPAFKDAQPFIHTKV
jgi:hypothetical protein